jgi:hypothetical protein
MDYLAIHPDAAKKYRPIVARIHQFAHLVECLVTQNGSEAVV